MSAAQNQARGLAAILGAARVNSMTREQAATLVATGYVESTWIPSQIGDLGTSFGLFQQHVGGAGGPSLVTARAYLAPARSASEAAARFKAAGVQNGAGAAASQRPAKRGEYAARVDRIRAAILGGTDRTFAGLLAGSPDLQRLAAGVGLAAGSTSATAGGATAGSARNPLRAKWSPTRDAVRKKARELGVRHNGGDRTPARNTAANGVPNSMHLTTRPEVWADDYAVSPALLAYAKTLPGVTEAMIHDAGSGNHTHVAGPSTGSGQGGAEQVQAGVGQVAGAVGEMFGDGGIAFDTEPSMADQIGQKALVVSVVLVGLGLGSALIYAGVTSLTGTDGIAGKIAAGGVPG